MFNLGKMWEFGNDGKPVMKRNDPCGLFHESLESLQFTSDEELTSERVLALLSANARQHAQVCVTCMDAVEDFAIVRDLLRPLSGEIAAPAPSPWFLSKVMSVIAAQEAEVDRVEGVWIGVRSLAPRLAAFSALLLVVAGTWAFQVQQQVHARQRIRPSESLFEPTPSAPLNDDVMAGVEERR